MRLTELFIGIFLIAFGILMYFFPNLIAGYNTLNKENKKKVDAKGLARLMRNAFIIFGLFIIVVYYTLSYVGLDGAARIIIPTSIPIFVILLLGLTHKYNIRK